MAYKYENIATIGERIRAYDFQGRTDCYIEGRVQRIDREGRETGCAAFAILVDTDAWPVRGQESQVCKHTGKDSRVGKVYYVPMELAYLEYDGRIERLPNKSV